MKGLIILSALVSAPLTFSKPQAVSMTTFGQREVPLSLIKEVQTYKEREASKIVLRDGTIVYPSEIFEVKIKEDSKTKNPFLQKKSESLLKGLEALQYQPVFKVLPGDESGGG